MNPFRPSGPPPVPLHSHPRASTTCEDASKTGNIKPSFRYPAGAIYAPGTWPTPELNVCPLGPWRVLSDPDFGWTSQSIQAALDAIGEGGTIYLPKSSKWDISEPVKLHPHQELATEGYPTAEGELAALEATKECKPHLISCWSTPGTRLRNLVIDGKHDVFGRGDDCGVMVQFGGSDPKCRDQWCDRCIIRNPRQWSCIQAFEGATNIRITNCRIGPAGVGKDVREGHWADGISYAASNGLIAGNEIIDATDGAIVVFQASGTLVTSNTIVCYSRLLLGGINMVDYAPNKGDYSQTRVVHNTILTAGGYIITGIAQGPTAWGGGPGQPSPDKVNRNAVVARNLIHYQDRGRGKGAIGYGFAISADVENWTCLANVSAHGVVYEGDMSDADWKGSGGLSVAPGPFVRATGPVKKMGLLQKEFVPGLVRGLLAINPGHSSVLRLFPGQLGLRPGEYISLKQWMFEFCRDGEIIFRHSQTGEIRWWAGSRGSIAGQEGSALLQLEIAGQLQIVNSSNPQQVLFNLTPMLPSSGLPSCTSDSLELPSLRISDAEPHLQLLSPDNGILLSSFYEVGMNTTFRVGAYVCRPAANGRASLVSVLSPYGQYMVLATRQGTEMSLPLTWPVDSSKWEIKWQTPNQPLPVKSDCYMAFQGDGNLVIYLNGKPLWSTGTHGPPERAARFMRWGDGSPEHPYLELLGEQRQRVWCS